MSVRKRKLFRKAHVQQMLLLVTMFTELQDQAVSIVDEMLKVERGWTVRGRAAEKLRAELRDIRHDLLSAVAVVEFPVRQPVADFNSRRDNYGFLDQVTVLLEYAM